MSKILFKLLSIVVLVIVIITNANAVEEETFVGFISQVCNRIVSLNLIPPGSLATVGPIKVSIDPDNIIYSELGLSPDKTTDFANRALSSYVMAIVTNALQRSNLSMLSLRITVLPVLSRLNIRTYDYVNEEKSIELMDALNVNNLIVGEVLNVEGKWQIRFGTGNSEVDSDLFDYETMLRLYRRAIAWYEPVEKEKNNDPITPPRETQEERRIPTPQENASLPVYTTLAFSLEDLRPASFTAPLAGDTFISVYAPIRNTANVSTQSSFIVLNKNGVAKINNSHSDTINGVLPDPERNAFHVYGDDGNVITYSLTSFEEIGRFNNIRPVKNLALSYNGCLVTNPGSAGSRVFNLATKTEVRGSAAVTLAASAVINTGDVLLTVRNGIIAMYDNGRELFQLACYTDGSYGTIVNNQRNYTGTDDLIEQHLQVIDPGRPIRSFRQSDRAMRN